jgi:hypothetical protein
MYSYAPALDINPLSVLRISLGTIEVKLLVTRGELLEDGAGVEFETMPGSPVVASLPLSGMEDTVRGQSLPSATSAEDGVQSAVTPSTYI